MNSPNTIKGNKNHWLLAFILFLGIVVAGGGSAVLGYRLGYESLKGISQPDSNPAKKLIPAQNSSENKKAVAIVSEKEILAKVDKFIATQTGNKKSQNSNSKNEKNKDTEKNNSFIKIADKQDKVNGQLPITVSDDRVSFTVVGVEKKDGDLLLEVNLVNQGNEPVEFLYSFLVIKNEKDRLLSSITEDLPSEILPNGEKVSGQIKIPLSLLDDSQELSLSLNDYPDENIQLKIPKISLEGLSGT